MKILIGNNHLHTLGGSETYTYTLASSLIKLGHNVEIMLGNPHAQGVMTSKIEKDLGIKVESLTGNYDKVFLNHNTTLNRFFNLGLSHNCDVYQICHGTIPNEEQPYISKDIKYISISEEVCEYIKNKYSKNSIIIRNLIDLDIYDITEIREKPLSVYSLAQSNTMNEILNTICKQMGMNFTFNNKHSNAQENIFNKIKPADIVVSLGRGCYEAMAMGKNVLIADMRSYMKEGYMDGMINNENFANFIKSNCSGRFNKIPINPELIKKEITKYNKNQGKENRKLIETYYNSISLTKQMLNL